MIDRKSPTYISWSRMRARCNRVNHPKRHRYGGRGIKVCERWSSFANFLADMGDRPPGTTIDRVDNDGNYEPANCRWATQLEQQRNRSTTKLNLTIADEIRSRRERGESRKVVASAYAVDPSLIRQIEQGKVWRRDA